MNTRVGSPRTITLVTLRPVSVFILLVGLMLWQFPEKQLEPLSVLILIVGNILLTAAFEGFIDFLALTKRKSDELTPGSGNRQAIFYLVVAALIFLYLFLSE